MGRGHPCGPGSPTSRQPLKRPTDTVRPTAGARDAHRARDPWRLLHPAPGVPGKDLTRPRRAVVPDALQSPLLTGTTTRHLLAQSTRQVPTRTGLQGALLRTRTSPRGRPQRAAWGLLLAAPRPWPCRHVRGEPRGLCFSAHAGNETKSLSREPPVSRRLPATPAPLPGGCHRRLPRRSQDPATGFQGAAVSLRKALPKPQFPLPSLSS